VERRLDTYWFDRLLNRIWDGLLNRPIDELNDDRGPSPLEALKRHFDSCEWHRCYEALEFIAKNGHHEGQNTSFMRECNEVLEQEGCPYRFEVESRVIVPVVEPEQREAVEEALRVPVGSVNRQLHQALLSLAQSRGGPVTASARNSIRESIHAVEGMSRFLLGDAKITLGESLRLLAERLELPPALTKALSALYGWASDEPGVRHSEVGETDPDASMEEAAFMLVTASAAVTYLYDKARAKGLLPSS